MVAYATDAMASYQGQAVATGSLSYPTPGLMVPQPERLTFQREANELADQITRAHAIMDQLSPVPSQGNASTALLPLSQALVTSREQMGRLLERLDGLLSMVGQV